MLTAAVDMDLQAVSIFLTPVRAIYVLLLSKVKKKRVDTALRIFFCLCNRMQVEKCDETRTILCDLSGMLDV